MAYATIEDLQARMEKNLNEAERKVAENLLDDAAVIIDAAAPSAQPEAKQLVSIRMVIRAIGSDDIPIGATQGGISALGYSQNWTFGGAGSTGELYLGRLEKNLLGISNAIGSYSPVEELEVQHEGDNGQII